MAIYLKYGNDDIKGDATQDKHENWININSFQFGVGRGISTEVGRGENRETSQPSLSEVVVTKDLDSSSVLFFQEATSGGKKGKTVTIDFVRTDEGGETYLQVVLSQTLLSGWSQSSGGDKPSESLSLNFTKIEFNETGGNKNGEGGSAIKAAYDMATGKK